jgi:O-antigen/teichoic acid export membrane protein
LVYFFAPSIALFFDNSELTFLIRIVGLNLIVSSFTVVQRTRLWINVDFKTLAKASFVAALISGIIGIYFAYAGLGVTALIIQLLVNTVVNTIVIFILVKWKISLKFSYERFVRLFKYAYKLILARLLNSVFIEIYSIVIGKVYSPGQLGYFNRAKSFTELSSGNITSIVQKVSVPLLCEAQHDNKRMGEVLVKFYVSGADSDEFVKVEWTNTGKPYEDGVRLKVNGLGDRVSLKVKLHDVQLHW